MKPLLQTQLKGFLERFNNFKDAEFRSLEIITPQNVSLTFALQDGARAHDWITLTLSFYEVSDAKLLTNNQLKLLDMSDGVCIMSESTHLAFGLGECYNSSSLKNATLYLIAKSIKYEEGTF